MVKSRTGRRPGESGTREAILAAARRAFADRGHRGATIRAIAGEAGVDPALVLHYFGSKDGLFAAAMAPPIDPARAVAAVTEGPADQAGLRVARFAMGVLEAPESRAIMLGIIRTSAGDERAAAVLRQIIMRDVYGPVAAHLGGEEPELRATLVGSQVLGMAMARYVVRLEPLASTPADAVVRWLAPVLQAYLTGPVPAPAPGDRGEGT
jgi:AcrR family transcriptional regulator